MNATLRNLPAVAALLLPLAGWTQDQRVKVEGKWDGTVLQVERVRQRDPGKDVRQIQIAGTVANLSHEQRRLQIGPVLINWNSDFDREVAGIETGDTVQVSATQSGHDYFVATYIEAERLGSDDSIELIGALTGYQNSDKWTDLWVAGIAARVPRHLFRNARMRSRRLDDRRPANQFSFSLGNVTTTLGGELEFKSDADAERNLDADEEDRNVDIDKEVQVEAFLDIGERVSAFAELKYEHSERYEIPWESIRTESELSRGAMWAYFSQPFGLPVGLQIGRQNFAENREWWWDDDLDAVRIDARIGEMTLELSVAEELGREDLLADIADPEDIDIFRALFRGTVRFSSSLTVDLFYLHQKDHSSANVPGQVLAAISEDETDARLDWIGARFSGDVDFLDAANVDYWIDIARVNGQETRYEFEDVGGDNVRVLSAETGIRRGFGVDVGASIGWEKFSWGILSEPTITLGFAMGSGADSSDGTFVQTGLNDNNGKFNGVNRFRYYGELLRPELSNLQLSTLAFGFRIGYDSSVEIVHHSYKQPHLSTQHSLRLDPDANGQSANLGQGLDLVVGIENWEHLQLEFVYSHFAPGRAFDQQDAATGIGLRFNFNF